MTKPDLDQARALAEKARQWASTPEGQRKLREAADRAVETTKELEQARLIDPKKLSEPFTVLLECVRE